MNSWVIYYVLHGQARVSRIAAKENFTWPQVFNVINSMISNGADINRIERIKLVL